MSLLVKRLFKINVHVTENKRISFCPVRVGPVRVIIYIERAVAQVDIRKIPRILLFRTRNQTNSRVLRHASPPPPLPLRRKPCRLHTVI